MKLPRIDSTWTIFALVVIAAASTLVPWDEPSLPGVLHIAVLSGEGEQRTKRAVTPLAEYLAESVRRSVSPEVVQSHEIEGEELRYDLALVPAGMVEQWRDVEILAWAKGCGLAGAHSRPFILFSKQDPWVEKERPRLILGDRWTWSGGRGAADFLEEQGHPLESGFGEVVHGNNPYDHAEAVHGIVHGSFDVAVLRETDVRQAVDAGVLDPTRFAFGPAGPSQGGFALVARNSLSKRARRKIREATLNLDLFRYDKKHQQAAAVLSALGLLGLEGFTPVEVLPSLRP